jgi:hypothetical protein
VASWRDSQLKTLGDRAKYRRRRANAWVGLAMLAGLALSLWAGRVILG